MQGSFRCFAKSFVGLVLVCAAPIIKGQTTQPDCTVAPYNLPAGPPTASTTAVQDQAHMMCLQGLQFPTPSSNPPLTTTRSGDPYKPVNAWPGNLTTPETSNWTDALGHTIVRWGWGAWTTYDDADSGGTANVLCNGAAGCTVAAQQGTSTGGATGGYGDYGPAGNRPYPTGSALLGDGNSTPCTSPGCLAAGYYKPIDMFTMQDGVTKITTPKEWWTQRRPQLLDLVQKELYGYVWPQSQWPAITWTIGPVTTGTQTGTINCAIGSPGCSTSGTITNGVSYGYRQKTYTGTLSTANYPASAPPLRNQPVINITCRFPATATGKVPTIISIGESQTDFQYTAPLGFGACGYTQTQLQADAGGAATSSYLSGLINGGNFRQPTEAGTLMAWAWGASRMVDEFALDPDPQGPDPDKVGIEGHSRDGKTALLTAAMDDRFVAALPSCGGEGGTSFIRRAFGESVESIVGNGEYYWMAGNLMNYAGPECQTNPNVGPAGCTPAYFPRKVQDLDVDSPQVMALIAPRAVMTNGGTDTPKGNGDAWQDPRGMYLTGALSGPVWQLLGWPGQIIPAGTVFTSNPTPYGNGESIGGTPPFDTSFISGTVAYRRHSAGHTDVPEWPVFVNFAAKYLNDVRPVINPNQMFLLPSASNTVGVPTGTNGGGGGLTNWQIKGGTGAMVFDIDPSSGTISIINRAMLTDASYTLVLMASDGILPAHDTTVTITPSLTTGSADATTTTVSVPYSTIAVSNPQTVSAKVTDTTTAANSPTGTVTFTDFYGGTSSAVGMGAVSGGVATATFTPSTLGTHNITANFASSDTTKFGNSSDPVGQTVTVVSDFSLSSANSLSVLGSGGGTATFNFTIAPNSGSVYPGVVTFTATNVPSGITVAFSPTTIAANAGSQTITVKVTVPSNSSRIAPQERSGTRLACAFGAFTLLGMLCVRRRRVVRALLAIGMFAVLAGAVTGCGGNQTPQGYAIQAVATSAGTSHSITLTTIVQ